jgi:hypothetical protein
MGAAASCLTASLDACRSGDFALTLQTSDPIPFAVRLNEVVRKSGVLGVLPGGFKFPPNSLGTSDVEKATTELQPDALDAMEPKKKP